MLSAKMNVRFLRALPVWKRAIDIVGATLGLVLLSPFLLLIAGLIKIVSPGPILFSQMRVGYRGKIFKLWKFRTMHQHADTRAHQKLVSDLIKNGRPMAKLDAKNDPRLIPFAKLLRAAGLDELPQLLNVLRGEMSLIGPRPCIPYEAQQYEPWQRERFEAVPGLTGLWQVSGKNRTTFNEMMRLDIAYAHHVSLWLDVKIILKTVPAIITQVNDSLTKHKNAEKQNVSKAPSFRRRLRLLGSESYSKLQSPAGM
jgi:lipopolysaccharide/colanic/teichoic acid biosynthesis glycosyltransferase